MQFLGQHFLKNPSVTQKIIASLDIKAGDEIIEVGPGEGALTLPLASACKKIGASLIAIEKDKRLVKELGRQINGSENETAGRIIPGDILEFLKDFPASTSSAPHLYKLVGNIPYYLTGHLLRIISELNNKPTSSVFMVQKEVAQRICDTPPKMNRLAASVQFWAEPKIITSVSRNDFVPVPNVDSAVIELVTKESQPHDADIYYSGVRAIFAQPRKTILNNLMDAKGISLDAENKKDDLKNLLLSLKITPNDRPQNLNIEQIASIAKRFFQHPDRP